MEATTTPRRRDWLVPVLLIVLSLVPAVAGSVRLAELTGAADITSATARFAATPMPMVLHILAVVPYSIIGAFQFAPAFRRRHRRLHRAAGSVLVVLGLTGALTGLWMAHFYQWPEGDGEALYVLRLVFGSAMALSIVLSLDAIRRRDFVAHGAWMIRGYAIGLGAGTHVLTHLPYFALVDPPHELGRALAMGAGWVINVVVAEVVIRRKERPEALTIPARLRGAATSNFSSGRYSG